MLSNWYCLIASIQKTKGLYTPYLYRIIGDKKMPISKAITERQKGLIEGIRKGTEEGKKEKEIAKALGISLSYVQLLKGKAGFTKSGSEVMDWVNKDRFLADWIAELRAERTKYGYAVVMKTYCDFREMTPLELLKEAEEDNKKTFDAKTVKHELLQFKTHLKDAGVSEVTIKTYIAAIQSFFKAHSVLLPQLKNGRVVSANKKEEYDREKVKQLIDVCPPREKALFLTMFQSSLASNEVANLKINDLKEVKDDITVLRLQRQKSGEFFTTFIGRDGRKAIFNYLRLRNEGNLIPWRPDISKLAEVKDDDDYVFVTWDARKHRWGKVTPHHISRYMMQACQKLGWEVKNGAIKRYNPNRPHALRASFATICINQGRIPKFFVDHMLGHALSPEDKAYFKAQKDKLFDYYKEAEHLLSVSNLEKIPNTKYEELMVELHTRNGKVKELEDKIASLEAREEAVNLKEEETKKIWDKIAELERKFAPLVENAAKIEETTERRKEAIVREGKVRR